MRGAGPPPSERFMMTRVGLALLAMLVAAPVVAGGGLTAQEPEMAPVTLDSVIVRGNVRQPEAVILAEAGLVPGSPVTYRDIQRAVRRLWQTGQYTDVQVYVRDGIDVTGAPAVLIIQVAEQPFIAEVEFQGLEHLRASTVRDTTGLRGGTPLRPARVAEAKALIRQMLAQQGYQVRSIDHRVIPIEGRPGEHRLVIDVREGPRIALAEVVFDGNTVFSDERLRSVMGTKPEGFFWFRPGTYDEERLRSDLRARLPAFYGEHGYIDFVVTGDTLIVDPASGKGRLEIQVAEGPQYRLADFEIRGNSRFPTAELMRYFERERGGLLSGLGFGRRAARDASVFDVVAFEKATQAVYQLYRNEGYLYARVEPVIEPVELPDGTPAVEVAWEIREGEPAYVNRVSVAGNTKTHEDVIRERIFILPGDVYNEDLLIQSYQAIMALGFFESPLPMPRIEPNERGDVDVTFEVVEHQTGSIQFGTAIGGGAGGLAGFLSYSEPNLFGQAKAGSLRWEFGRWSNNFEASYSDPALARSRVSSTLSVFSARDRFNPFRTEGQRRRTGAGLRFGLPLPTDPRFTRLVVGYSLSRTTYEQDPNVESSVFGLPPGVQSTVILGVSRNTLNHPIFPTSGTRQHVEGNFSGGPLGGHGHFQKYTFDTNWFVPVGQLGGTQPGSRPVRFTVGLTAEGGALVGDASRFPFERFWMGGVQFGRPLRGYGEATITPDGYNPRATGLDTRFGDAYLRLSAEGAVRFTDQLSASLFYDAGNVWRGVGAVNPTRLLRGAGVGVSIVTPFGPIGLDYAYGFDKDVPGWQLHFKFGPGF
jgi:outer membrane protein insertion porin family